MYVYVCTHLCIICIHIYKLYIYMYISYIYIWYIYIPNNHRIYLYRFSGLLFWVFVCYGIGSHTVRSVFVIFFCDKLLFHNSTYVRSVISSAALLSLKSLHDMTSDTYLCGWHMTKFYVFLILRIRKLEKSFDLIWAISGWWYLIIIFLALCLLSKVKKQDIII